MGSLPDPDAKDTPSTTATRMTNGSVLQRFYQQISNVRLTHSTNLSGSRLSDQGVRQSRQALRPSYAAADHFAGGYQLIELFPRSRLPTSRRQTEHEGVVHRLLGPVRHSSIPQHRDECRYWQTPISAGLCPRTPFRR